MKLGFWLSLPPFLRTARGSSLHFSCHYLRRCDLIIIIIFPGACLPIESGDFAVELCEQRRAREGRK